MRRNRVAHRRPPATPSSLVRSSALAGTALALACAHPRATPRDLAAYRLLAGQLASAETSAARPR
ncbi:MAG: hypothetical protein M3303_13855, partial [Gemmatimonadota bacterium]|nr:hypothetical protein [Gemmatimonadota bacterium]